MNKIQVGDDWGHSYTLDGATLKNGEMLRVQWPDGSVTTDRCHIGRELVSEKENVWCQRAYVIVIHRGHGVEVPLVSLSVERVTQ